MKAIGLRTALCVLGVVLGFCAPATAGKAVPFKGCFVGALTSRTPIVPPVFEDRFDISGHATHLGEFDLVIDAIVEFGNIPVTGEGTYTFTAANGDILVAQFTGHSALVQPGLVLITEEATIDPELSTGRFAGATGGFTVERLADAATGVNGLTLGHFEGTISRPRKGK